MKHWWTCDPKEAHEVSALMALRANERGAERAVLDALKESVIRGKTPDPIFQGIANAIVAKAIISGKLPNAGKGRPKQNLFTGPIGWDIAYRHMALMDAGKTYAEATEIVGQEFKLGDREIQRIVRKNKSTVEARHGNSKSERDLDRKRRNTPFEPDAAFEEAMESIFSTIDQAVSLMDAHRANEASPGYVAELNRSIELLLKL